jgi:hypothetical protein
MTTSPRSSFFAPPSLGGKLAIANLNGWVIIFLIGRSEVLPPDLPLWLQFAVAALLFILAMPLGMCIPMMSGPAPLGGIVMIVLILAANAFVWGYGLAWCLRRAQAAYRSWREPRPRRRLPRHFPPIEDSQS